MNLFKNCFVFVDLKRAMTKREIEELEQAINTVKKHGLEVQLAKELGEANHLLTRLRRLERIRHEILELKQSTVAEIRSYQSPPIIVHTVMTSTFLVLGHKEKETKVLIKSFINFSLTGALVTECSKVHAYRSTCFSPTGFKSHLGQIQFISSLDNDWWFSLGTLVFSTIPKLTPQYK